MLDYIFVDYLDYIIPYFFFISIGIFSACIIYKAFFGNNKVVSGILIFSVLTVLFGIIYPNFQSGGSGPHYNCNGKFEREAQYIAAAIADYFSIPTRTQVPNYSDLVFSKEYNNTLLKTKNLKRRDKLIKESGFSVDILGDEFGGITIVLSSKRGKCPFYRWKCPRRFKGEIYVFRMGGNGVNEWLDSWEDI